MKTHKNLESIWQPDHTLAPQDCITTNLTCDVCIVGAGITGLSTAYELTVAGKNVIVLTDKTLDNSDTVKTSAHLSNALDDRYYRIETMHGKENAILAASSHADAITRIEQICHAENIQCDFMRVPGYLFSHTDNSDEIEEEHAAARRAGINVTYLDAPLRGKSLVFPDQARFHPVKYIEGLAEAIQKRGGKIYTKTQVSKVDFKKLELVLANGLKIKAQKIIFATNAPCMPNMTMHFRLNPQRSYTIGLKIPKHSVEDALYWDTADPYHYVRRVELDETNDMLIVGGEDHRVGTEPGHNPFAALLAWVQTKFPVKQAEIMYQWSGQILEPSDYLALIGQHPKSPHAYMSTGDSGNGLTHGVIASQIMADAVLEKKNPYASLYQTKRFKLRSISKLLGNLVASSVAYFKYFLPQRQAELKPGEGKIMQQGLKKIAVYKDEAGKLHTFSGSCPHLGAVLSWNAIEKSWDCAAHGSRFDVSGKCLNGPSMQNLPCQNLKKPS